MGLHTWSAAIYVEGEMHRLSGVANLPENPDRSQQYPAEILFREVVRGSANKEFGVGTWSVARQFDPYAWNASPAADRGLRATLNPKGPDDAETRRR